MDTFLWILGLTVVVLAVRYLWVPSARRRRWQAYLQQPSTRGDIRGLETEVSDVSSKVSGIREELGELRTAVSDVSYLSEISLNVEGIREEFEGIREEFDSIREEFEGVRGDLKAMRRLHRAVAHQQWSPEWTPE
jgi:septation ring formation regulator EzrA